MRYGIAFLLKWVVQGLLLGVAFYSYDISSVTAAIFISFLICTLTYVPGDLYVLTDYGNAVATAVDFGAAWWILGVAGTFPGVALSWTGAAVLALAVAVAESLFHVYMQRAVLLAPRMK